MPFQQPIQTMMGSQQQSNPMQQQQVMANMLKQSQHQPIQFQHPNMNNPQLQDDIANSKMVKGLFGGGQPPGQPGAPPGQPPGVPAMPSQTPPGMMGAPGMMPQIPGQQSDGTITA